MKCPYCNLDMRKGGLSINGTGTSWQNEEDFEDSPYRNLISYNEFTFGKSSVLTNQTRVPNSYYCESCDTLIIKPVNAIKPKYKY